MATQMSLYIPRVHNSSHTKDGIAKYTSLVEFMTSLFHTMDIGEVSRIDFVPIPGPGGKHSNFSKAFVHFNRWYTTQASRALQERIVQSEMVGSTMPVRFMYNDPHYWILKPNKSHANDRTKISSLEKQVVDLNMKISSYSDLLASATHQLSCMKSFDETDYKEELPYKRKRNITFSN